MLARDEAPASRVGVEIRESRAPGLPVRPERERVGVVPRPGCALRVDLALSVR
jgi:hypothetical protein